MHWLLLYLVIIFCVLSGLRGLKNEFDVIWPQRIGKSQTKCTGLVENSMISPRSRLTNVYTSEQRIFPYYDTALATQVDRFSPEYSISNYAEKHSERHQYSYYSGNIMNDLFHDLRKELKLIKQVNGILRDKELINRLTGNLWVGDSDVVASAHYDSVYNIYIQIEGNKTFKLLPPPAVHNIGVHGRMHPYACQSRVSNLTEGSTFHRAPYCITADCSYQLAHNSTPMSVTVSATCSDAISVNKVISDVLFPGPASSYQAMSHSHGLTFTLQPGDMLIIPPFWFHEVETHSAAVALSWWWDATELDAMDEIYALPLPLQSDWDGDTLIRVTHLLCSELLSTVTTFVSHRIASKEYAFQPSLSITDNLRDYFSEGTLLRLLKIRYLEDWIYLSHPRTCAHLNESYNASCCHDFDLSGIKRAVRARAEIFSLRFLTEDVFLPLSSLNIFNSTSSSNSSGTRNTHSAGSGVDITREDAGESVNRGGATMSLESGAEEGEGSSNVRINAQEERNNVCKNQLAVLSIKLCDYVEDIFHQLAKMLQSIPDHNHNNNHKHTFPADGDATTSTTHTCPARSAKGRKVNELAVDLLLDWLSLQFN